MDESGFSRARSQISEERLKIAWCATVQMEEKLVAFLMDRSDAAKRSGASVRFRDADHRPVVARADPAAALNRAR
ncbi:hypothetical protein D8B30_09385 [Verminephrobacter eiseniae]|nr:hypothetical protein [Verminephrobacter eiseniae]MCW8189997.1 hypothetical protein [Verminephrobacter eiseniae]